MLRLEMDDQVTPLLRLIDTRLGDLTAPLARIGGDGMRAAQVQVIEGKGSAWGGAPWAPMAPATIAKGRNPATLGVDKGKMADSLSRGRGGNIFEVTPTSFEGGTNLVSERGFAYPSAFHGGTSRQPGRHFMQWYSERFDTYNSIIADFVMSGEVTGGNA